MNPNRGAFDGNLGDLADHGVEGLVHRDPLCAALGGVAPMALVAEPVAILGPPSDEDLAACAELGAVVAATTLGF